MRTWTSAPSRSPVRGSTVTVTPSTPPKVRWAGDGSAVVGPGPVTRSSGSSRQLRITPTQMAVVTMAPAWSRRRRRRRARARSRSTPRTVLPRWAASGSGDGCRDRSWCGSVWFALAGGRCAVVEGAVEALTGLVERRLDGAGRDAQDLGDLPDRKVGEVVEDDRTALAFREARGGRVAGPRPRAGRRGRRDDRRPAGAAAGPRAVDAAPGDGRRWWLSATPSRMVTPTIRRDSSAPGPGRTPRPGPQRRGPPDRTRHGARHPATRASPCTTRRTPPTSTVRVTARAIALVR